jgi:hypothetical protein
MNASTTLSRNTVSYGLSLAIVSVINALVVVAKESSKSVMTGMQRVMGHHWVTHSAIMIALFAIIGWTLSRSNNGAGPTITPHRLLTVLLSGVGLGAVIIVGFYLIGD